MKNKNKTLKYTAFSFFFIVGVSAIFGTLGSRSWYDNFINSLFYISGVVMIISGFRWIYQKGGFKFFGYMVYKARQVFKVSSLSNRKDFIDQKEEELEDYLNEKAKGVKSKDSKKKSEKTIEDFIEAKIDVKQTNTAMFISSILTLLLSFVLVLM